MDPVKHYAHSRPGQAVEHWQELEDHLLETSELAEAFARGFAPGWGRVAGHWHDAGKYQDSFQEYIRRDPEAHVGTRVDHSSVGALLARSAVPLAFAIAGHHGGMPNRQDLVNRLSDKAKLLGAARAGGLPILG